jgi:hypothetical protein
MNKTQDNPITLPRLAGRLGLQHYQLQYWIQTGRIPDGEVRPGSKRKTWTQEQADAIENWYRDYVRIDAGCCGRNGHGVARLDD